MRTSATHPRLCAVLTRIAHSEKDCSYVWPDFPPPGAHPAVWTFDFPGDSSGGLNTDNPWNDRLQSFQCLDECQS